MFIRRLHAALPPHEAALRLGRFGGLAWLDGSLAFGREGEFSFLGVLPDAVVERPFGAAQPLSALDLLVASRAAASGDEQGGLEASAIPEWIGHIAYDAHWSERSGTRLARDRGLPCLRFARYPALYAYDHRTEHGFLVGDSAEACDQLERRLAASPLSHVELRYHANAVERTSAARHSANVRRALEFIREGTVYEVNLARRYSARFEGSALGLFLRMRALSPVPLGYFVEAPDHAVLGRSMERFLRHRAKDDALWTSPIKGTVARAGHDIAEARALRADPKEHAEHAMVVDLMRNDLSRVSVPGSVEVRELMTVLPFRGLSHLVSTVASRALPDLCRSALLEGVFPPGSITGAPKRTAIEIIEALESAPRGIYTGAMGFVDRAGGCSFAVAIRTATIWGGEVDYFAGGGIVIDSDPERETAETDLKARVFLEAIGAIGSALKG